MTLRPKIALILDFGGVITRTIFEQHRRTERILGLPVGSLTWLGPLDPDADDLWQRVRRGTLTEQDYWRARAREVGALLGEIWDEPMLLFRRALGDDPNETVRAEAVHSVLRLKARGVRLAVLSNELERYYGPTFRTDIDLLSEIGVIVDGTHSKIRKPDPRAYERCLRELGISPAEAVFVDDMPRNVEGARKVGLEAFHFDIRHPGQCYAEIEARFLDVVRP